ncbi:uroporphyrinogen decarboxylase [Dermatophagoides pteronyssinus]|uniref:uroporphyrinogen decarboxylase n=1 Tax=Dermatophagoides pteronyssinus TaxID=6956 RepID=UPI003F664C16
MMEKEFPELKNDTIIRQAFGKKTSYIPVWVMRQAGRYLPEFREFRQHHSFFDICETPELACEATMLPIRRYPSLDAAIIFSDILVIPKALGMDVQMVEGIGPVVDSLEQPSQIKTKIHVDNNIDAELDYLYKAITLTRHTLEGKVPLIGFAGGPFTLMSYMIEGQGSKTMSKVKRWFYQNPIESHELLDILTKAIIQSLVGQVKAGAQMLQVFESHAGYLGPRQFDEFCLPYLNRISYGVKEQLREQNLDTNDVPMILFAKGAHYALDKMCDTTCHQYNVIGLDWTIDADRAKKASNGRVTLQGNLDPCALYSNQDDLDYLVEQMVQEFGNERYIANLGHGIYPDVKWENVATFVNAVHKYSKIHSNK